MRRGDQGFVGEKLGDEVGLEGLGESEGRDVRKVDVAEDGRCGHRGRK